MTIYLVSTGPVDSLGIRTSTQKQLRYRQWRQSSWHRDNSWFSVCANTIMAKSYAGQAFESLAPQHSVRTRSIPYLLMAWLLEFARLSIAMVSTRQNNLGLSSLSGRTSYHKISWRLEAVRLDVIMIVSLWNLTGISAAPLPRCLSNFKAIEKV